MFCFNSNPCTALDFTENYTEDDALRVLRGGELKFKKVCDCDDCFLEDLERNF